MTSRISLYFLIVLCQSAFASAALAEETNEIKSDVPTAVLRSTSFITRDIDKSVEFYTGFLGYSVLKESLIEPPKSRQVVGAQRDGEVRFIVLSPANWSEEDAKYSGISFIHIPWAESGPFNQDATRPSREAELVLSHRVTNIREIEKHMRKAGVPFITELSKSGSGKSWSMAVLDPNGIRVEMYEY